MFSNKKEKQSDLTAFLLGTYWQIGRLICEYEQSDAVRAEYGKQTLKILSKELTNEFGKGFSVSNIQFMRRFYQAYQIQQTPSVKLAEVEKVLEKWHNPKEN